MMIVNTAMPAQYTTTATSGNCTGSAAAKIFAISASTPALASSSTRSPEAAAPYTVFTTAHGLPADLTWGVHDLPGGGRMAVTSEGFARMVPDPSRPGGLRFERFGPRVRLLEPGRADTSGLWFRCLDAEGRVVEVTVDPIEQKITTSTNGQKRTTTVTSCQPTRPRWCTR